MNIKNLLYMYNNYEKKSIKKYFDKLLDKIRNRRKYIKCFFKKIEETIKP